MNINKSNKKLIGVPYASNKILKNKEIYDHQIININTMYVDDNENINSEINTENEYLLKEKNKYIKYSSFEYEKKRNENNYCIKEMIKEFLFYIGCIDKIN